ERRRRLERDQHIERAAVHLREHAPTFARRLLDGLEPEPPRGRLDAPREDAEGDGAPGIQRELFELRIIVRSLRPERDLEDAGARLAHRAYETLELAPARLPACDRPTAGGLVPGGARGREPDGASLDRLADVARHRLQIVLARGTVEGALAHDVGPECGMADVARVVDALRQTVEHVQELREGLPAPLDAGAHG